MNHQRYAPEAFEPDGTLKTSPSRAILSTLGKYGMGHPLLDKAGLSDAREGKESDLKNRLDQVSAIRSNRAEEYLSTIVETAEGKSFKELYEAASADVGRITQLIGEKPPTLLEGGFLEQAKLLMESYVLLEKLGQEPQLVLAPVRQSVDWWLRLGKSLERSPLNPTKPDPDSIGTMHRVIRNGGVEISEEIASEWAYLTGCGTKEPGWSLSVMSTKSQPDIRYITTYGYVDDQQTIPDKKMNKLLYTLGMPLVKERHVVDPYVQPDIHPSIETFIMYQLTRVLDNRWQTHANSANEPWTWLAGELMLSYRVPVGRSFDVSGCVGIIETIPNLADHLSAVSATIRGAH